MGVAGEGSSQQPQDWTTSYFHMVFSIGLAYNAASFQSLYSGSVQFTLNDPVVAMVIQVIFLLLLRIPSRSRSGGCVAVVGIFLWSGGGILRHILNAAVYQTNPKYHSSYWVIGVVLNVLTILLWERRIGFYFGQRGGTIIAMAIAVFSATVTVLHGSMLGAEKLTCSDKPWFTVNPTTFAHLPHKRTSHYVPMSDGVELAVDVYLPRDYAAQNDTRLPSFLHFTRYRRAESRSWLTRYISLFGHAPNIDGYFPMRSMHLIDRFVPSGYAFVSVDVRGTGASFGSRPVDLIQREQQDLSEMVQWTKTQAFCNGKIGTGGISYDGITGAIAAGGTVPGIAAAALLFAPGDLYEDIAFAGGVATTGFLKLYGAFTSANERNANVQDVDNELPATFKLLAEYGFNGVAPVVGKEESLPKALAQHATNFDMVKGALSQAYTKDTPILTHEGVEYLASSLGIDANVFEGLKQNNVSVYSVAGYYDSGSVRSAARLHNYLAKNGGKSKLTVGPWSHGARSCFVPTNPATTPAFPLFDDVKRFFDCELKEIGCGRSVDRQGPRVEPAIHYFVSGARAEWASLNGSTTSFPGASIAKTWENFQLGTEQIDYTVDQEATSGVVSRWNLVQHLMRKPVVYDERKAQIGRGLGFDIQTFVDPFRVAGSVVLQLDIAVQDGKDAVIFAYLDDIDPKSAAATYITEGNVRAAFTGDLVEACEVGAFDCVNRTFLRKDLQPLASDVKRTVNIVFEPIVYELAAGHLLRLTLAGADKDNFDYSAIPDVAKRWVVYGESSVLKLPQAH